MPVRRAGTAMLWLSAPARAEICPPPGTDCTTGTLQVVDFETVSPGTSVEGLGAVHPDLAITSTPAISSSCTVGTAVGIEEFNPSPLAAYGTASGANGCLNGIRGYGDDPLCILNYEYTFSPGSTVSCFSIRLLDYGDFFPFGGVNHNVRPAAYAGSRSSISSCSRSPATRWRMAMPASRTKGNRGTSFWAWRAPASTA
jgi:hypothetical protein